MEFVLNRNGRFLRSWIFLLPPESFEAQEPVRQNTMRTVAGGYSDLFGPDLPTLTIEGTPGADIRKLEGGQFIDGYTYWLQFLHDIYHAFVESPLQNPNDEYTLHLYNWTHNKFWDVMPNTNTWDMAVPESGVFFYQLDLIALEPLNRPRTQPVGTSYDTIVTNNTANFVSVAKQGATHGAMVSTLLGYNVGKVRYVAI